MKLEGIHHISAITGDAVGNVEFYTGVLGLRMVKRTVNQDEPNVYHLFYGDEHGSPGMDLTFFEYPGAARGIAGAGMIHRIVWRVASPQSLEFWHERLTERGVSCERTDDSLLFVDPEGLEHELVHSDAQDEPLSANAPDIPSRARASGLRGRARVQQCAGSQRAPAQRGASGSPAERASTGRFAASAEAASTPTTRRRRRSTARRARARCITWRSPP